MTTASYKAFISYSHADRAAAEWLHKYLESYRVPRRLVGHDTPQGPVPARLQPLFRDRDELPTAVNLSTVIGEALARSENLIVLCSPRAAQSRWVNEEIRQFKALGRSSRVFCIIVAGGTDAAGRQQSHDQCFPPAALFEIGADGALTERRAEPVAADARPEGDGLQAAALKLVAGLIGIGYGELRDRERARRQRRLAIVASTSLAISAVMGVLTVFAFSQRHDALEARARAEVEATTARQTTSFLVSLFSVAAPSESRGNTISAREILDAGVGRIETELKQQPAVQATLMQTMGTVYTGLGLYEPATHLLSRSIELRPRTAPDSAIERVRTLTALGAVLKLRAEYTEAERSLRAAVAGAEALGPSAAPELGNALRALGDNLVRQERLPEADQVMARALEIARKAHAGPSVDTANAEAGLAMVRTSEGRFADASTLFASALAAHRALLGADHPSVAEDLNQLGSVEWLLGHREAATTYYGEALPLYRHLYGAQHPEVASVLNNLGRLLLEQRRFTAAQSLLEEALSIDRKERSADHDDLIYPLNSLGLVALGRGDPAAAESLLREALRIARLHEHPMRGPVLVALADTLCRSGRSRLGLPLLDEAATRMHADYPDEPWRGALVDSVRGGCLVGLDRAAEAEPLLASSVPVLAARWPGDLLFAHDARERLTHCREILARPQPVRARSAAR